MNTHVIRNRCLRMQPCRTCHQRSFTTQPIKRGSRLTAHGHHFLYVECGISIVGSSLETIRGLIQCLDFWLWVIFSRLPLLYLTPSLYFTTTSLKKKTKKLLVKYLKILVKYYYFKKNYASIFPVDAMPLLSLRVSSKIRSKQQACTMSFNTTQGTT